MTARTLEEIEALAAMCTFGPWAYFRHDCKELAHIESFEVTFGDKYGTAWIQSGGGNHPKDLGKSEAEANAALMASAPRLLAIAQEQRAALLAIWPFVEEDDGGFATPQYQAAINQVRAILGIGTKK